MSAAAPGGSRLGGLLGRVPRASAPLTLRNRLILSIVAIVVLLTVVIGTVSVVALRGSLMNQLDDDLTGATNRALTAASIGGSSGRPSLSPDSDALGAPRQAPGTFTAVLVGDGVQRGAVLGEEGLVGGDDGRAALEGRGDERAGGLDAADDLDDHVDVAAFDEGGGVGGDEGRVDALTHPVRPAHGDAREFDGGPDPGGEVVGVRRHDARHL